MAGASNGGAPINRHLSPKLPNFLDGSPLPKETLFYLTSLYRPKVALKIIIMVCFRLPHIFMFVAVGNVKG
jgi:hypothetical protein